MSGEKLDHQVKGQILEKVCEHYGGHIYDPIFMKLGQNVCLDNI